MMNDKFMKSLLLYTVHTAPVTSKYSNQCNHNHSLAGVSYQGKQAKPLFSVQFFVLKKNTFILLLTLIKSLKIGYYYNHMDIRF